MLISRDIVLHKIHFFFLRIPLRINSVKFIISVSFNYSKIQRYVICEDEQSITQKVQIRRSV